MGIRKRAGEYATDFFFSEPFTTPPAFIIAVCLDICFESSSHCKLVFYDISVFFSYRSYVCVRKLMMPVQDYPAQLILRAGKIFQLFVVP